VSSDMRAQRQDEWLRPTFADAIRYWERRRAPYNLVLVAFVVAWAVLTWPHFRPALAWSALLRFAVLGAIANLCYCAAYVVDLPIRGSSFGATWVRRSWMLWSIGTLFAVVLENYWIADEIYPFVR
jgi:hypothetical protein